MIHAFLRSNQNDQEDAIAKSDLKNLKILIDEYSVIRQLV